MKNYFPIFTTIFFLSCTCFFYAASAQTQIGFQPFIRNLSSPVEIRNAGDGTNRLFIVEQGGLIKIYKNGILLSRPFIDLSKVVGKNTFQGIWSIAFSPNYKVDNTFFLLLTDKKSASNLMRFQTSAATDADSAVAASGVILISVPGKGIGGPHFGDMHFGQDGYLYYTWSDGSSPI